MINFSYLFRPSTCGYYCLRHITKKIKFINKKYMSLYEMKDALLKFNIYCFCCRVKSLENVKRECVTLMFTKTNFHYIVIKQVTCSHVYFYDPLFLLVRKMKKDRFLKKWSKICLFYIKI